MHLYALSFKWRTLLSRHTLEEEAKASSSFSLSREEAETLATLLQKETQNQSILVLATCERLEIYIEGEKTPKILWNHLKKALSSMGRLNAPWAHPLPPKGTIVFRHELLFNHLVRMGSGLDSDILGEAEVLGQLKSAYRFSKKKGFLQGQLQYLLEHAFEGIKSIRFKMNPQGTLSLTRLSAMLAKDEPLFSKEKKKEKRKILILGAGEIAKGCLQYLKGEDITVLNRTQKNLEELKKNMEKEGENIQGDSIEHLSSYIEKAHVLIGATSSPKTWVSQEFVENKIKQGKALPSIWIDLASPPDISPALKKMNLKLYTLEDLVKKIQITGEKRKESFLLLEAKVHTLTQNFVNEKKSKRRFAHIFRYLKKREQRKNQPSQWAKKFKRGFFKEKKPTISTMTYGKG